MLLTLILSVLYEGSIFEPSTYSQFNSMQSMDYIEAIRTNVKFPQCTRRNVKSSESFLCIGILQYIQVRTVPDYMNDHSYMHSSHAPSAGDKQEITIVLRRP
jgi:hypothetical protein